MKKLIIFILGLVIGVVFSQCGGCDWAVRQFDKVVNRENIRKVENVMDTTCNKVAETAESISRKYFFDE